MIQTQAIRTFHDTLREGQRGEEILDKFFGRWYRIQFANTLQEDSGIDRIFTPLFGSDKKQRTVEYKTDFCSANTGNAYLEIVSQNVKKIPGWLKTSVADWLIYFIYPKQVLIFKFEVLREFVFSRKYRERSVKNKGYFGTGLIVPLTELMSVAHEILEVKND